VGTPDTGTVTIADNDEAAFGPGEASDPSLGDSPLRVTGYHPGDGTVTVTFEAGCDATDHAVYSGALAAVSSSGWDRASCGLGAGPDAVLDPGPGDRFLVIVAQHVTAEGSYGTRSDGAERPEAVGIGACDLPQVLETACP
jgi:hypothetical protein